VDVNSKRSIAAAEIAIHFCITAAFALSYDSPHDFAVNGMLSDVNGLLPSDICRFRAITVSPLYLSVNWPVFTINRCCFTSKFNSKGPPSSPLRICLTLKWVIHWVGSSFAKTLA